MKKRHLVFIAIFSSINPFLLKGSMAQSSIDNTRANQAMSQAAATGVGPGGILYEFSSSDKTTKELGDTYYDIYWSKSSLILLDNKVIEGYLGRYDIKGNEFEFKFQNGIRVIGGDRIKKFVWVDSLSRQTKQLVNTKDYLFNGVPFYGVAELLVDGETVLFKKITIDEIPPTFNSALNVGSQDYTLAKKVQYFFTIDNNLYELKKRSALKVLQTIKPDVENFCRKESITWRKENDLVRLFNYLNSN
ncbi:MAG: hypothetical protein HOP37_05065 [Cyclobacteriaceae bacterium]|nr:hypothetical protein [Cyclobacteriaceae bacterium]